MKKQRGLRRYYKNLAAGNDFSETTLFDCENIADAWFDRRHWHFDRNGLGNHSFRSRKPHLDKLFRHFEILVESVRCLKCEFQLFALLLDRDSSSDALFLHTPNPNGSAFPLTWDDLSENCTLKNQHLMAYVDGLVGYEKLYGVADEPFCILVRKNTGIQTASYRIK